MKHSFNKVIAQKYGIPEAILFENISYWCEKNEANKNNIHDDNSWTYNTYEAFEELFPYLKPNTIKKALRALKEAGLIDIRNDLSVNKWDKTNWYSIVNFDNYREAKKSTLDSQKKAPSKVNKKHDHIKEHLLNTNITTDIKHNYYKCEELPYFNDPNFSKAWQEWNKIRKTKKCAFTEYAYDKIYNKFEKWAKGDINIAITMLDKSILSGYSDVYEIKEFSRTAQKNNLKWKGEQNFDF